MKGILENQQSYLDAISSARNRYQTEETALSNVTDALTRLREITIQAASDTLGPVDRQALALEMAGLRDQIMSLANTQDENGLYIFRAAE